MRIHRDERGQTIVLVAFSLPLILGFIGIATDVGALLRDKRTLQTAADAAAIAGAENLNFGTSPMTTAAKAASAANGYTDGTGGVTVTINDPPLWPGSNYKGTAGTPNGFVEATVTKNESTIFLALFGRPSVTVLARAVAANSGPSAACLYTTGATGLGITVSSNATINAATSTAPCAVLVDSNTSPPMNVTGALNAKSIGTVGSCSGGCGTNVSPPPVSPIIPYSDPLSFLPVFTCNGTSSCTNGIDTYACNPDPNINTASRVTLDPGCYNGLTINGSGIVTFNPGTYVLNGSMTSLGTNILVGSGVTFYINTGVLSISNFTTFAFYAPNAPGTPYNGILFAQTASVPAQQTINIPVGSLFVGILYFPNAQLTVNTTGVGGPTLYAGFVAQSLVVSSQVSGNTITLNDYASAPGIISSPLSSVVLVE